MRDPQKVIQDRIAKAPEARAKADAHRAKVWASIETSSPGLAIFMKQIAAETGKPAAVRVVIDGKVILDTGGTK